MPSQTFKISGMHCPSCKILIEDVCSEIPGVHSMQVDSQTGVAVVEHGENFDTDLLKSRVEELGSYKVDFSK